MKCPSEHLLFENQQICYFKSYNSPSSDDFLTRVPRVLGPCVRSSVFWSHLHAWGCWLQVIRLAVYRVLPAFKDGTISGIQSHIITTSPVNLSCRCRFSLLCVGHLRILPGAPPQDAGLGAGVSQPRALHPLATELTDTGSMRQAFWQLSSVTKRHYHLYSPADKHDAMCTTTLLIDRNRDADTLAADARCQTCKQCSE